MELEKNKAVFFPLSRGRELFPELGDRATSLLASIGSDITLVIGPDGVIADMAFRAPDLAAWNCDRWIGRKWREIVTEESVEKVDALLEEAGRQAITRRRQVNHPAKNAADLPVDYLVVSFPGAGHRLALGNDLRKMAALQRQLVQFQMELEGEYRKIRENESRYRTLFQLSGEPVIVVGDNDMRILDANQAAAAATGRPTRKMAGENVANLFEKQGRDAVVARLNDIRRGGRGQTFAVRLAGGGAEQTASVEPYRESGRSNLVIRLSGSGNALRRPDPIGPQIEFVPEALAVTDAAGDVIAANDAFLDLVHCQNLDHALGKRLHNWLGGSSVDLQVLMTRLREESSIRGFATLVRDELGVDSPVLVSASRSTPENGAERYAFLISPTPRRQAQLGGPAGAYMRDMGDFSDLVGRVPLKELIREAADVIEVMCIEAALRQTDNNRASAAELLGLSRQSLYLKLRRYGIADYGYDS